MPFHPQTQTITAFAFLTAGDIVSARVSKTTAAIVQTDSNFGMTLVSTDDHKGYAAYLAGLDAGSGRDTGFSPRVYNGGSSYCCDPD